MAKTAKATAEKEATHDEIGAPKKKTVVIRRKNAAEFAQMFSRAAQEHWRKLRLVIQIREKLHAGKPAVLDAAEAMLKARGLEKAIEAVNVDDPNELSKAAEEVVNQGLCEFHRREGKPGMWWPANHMKACLKENWSVLGYRVEYRGSRGALAEGVFVCSTDPKDRDWIRLGDSPDGIDQSVAHTTGPKGPQASIKRNEFLVRPKITFEIWFAKVLVDKLPDEAFVDMLTHAAEHGIGANRSQGKGRFDILSLEDID